MCVMGVAEIFNSCVLISAAVKAIEAHDSISQRNWFSVRWGGCTSTQVGRNRKNTGWYLTSEWAFQVRRRRFRSRALMFHDRTMHSCKVPFYKRWIRVQHSGRVGGKRAVQGKVRWLWRTMPHSDLEDVDAL